jgi:hypothetical protein
MSIDSQATVARVAYTGRSCETFPEVFYQRDDNKSEDEEFKGYQANRYPIVACLAVAQKGSESQRDDYGSLRLTSSRTSWLKYAKYFRNLFNCLTK